MLKNLLEEFKELFPYSLLGLPLDKGVQVRGGQTFPKSTEFRNSVAFCPFFGSSFPCFSVRAAESVS